MAEKNIPIRTCVCCRNEFPKRELLRITRDKGGNIFYDASGKSDGRGAYVCKSESCINRLTEKKMIGRLFSQNVSQDVYDELRRELLGREKN